MNVRSGPVRAILHSDTRNSMVKDLSLAREPPFVDLCSRILSSDLQRSKTCIALSD